MFEEYKKLYEESPDELDKPSKELVEAWLDAQIEMHREIQRAYDRYDVPLCFGALDYEKGEYESEIFCDVGAFDFIALGTPELQIWNGIDKIADILGLPLKVEDLKRDTWRWEYSIEYKGVKVTQLEEREL